MNGTGTRLAALGALLLAGCVAGGPNPLSLGIHTANASVSHAVGMASAAEITPAEKAKYDAMSCGELTSMIANYQAGLKAMPDIPVKNDAAAKKAMAKQVMETRLAYLQGVVGSRKCWGA